MWDWYRKKRIRKHFKRMGRPIINVWRSFGGFTVAAPSTTVGHVFFWWGGLTAVGFGIDKSRLVSVPRSIKLSKRATDPLTPTEVEARNIMLQSNPCRYDGMSIESVSEPVFDSQGFYGYRHVVLRDGNRRRHCARVFPELTMGYFFRWEWEKFDIQPKI